MSEVLKRGKCQQPLLLVLPTEEENYDTLMKDSEGRASSGNEGMRWVTSHQKFVVCQIVESKKLRDQQHFMVCLEGSPGKEGAKERP